MVEFAITERESLADQETLIGCPARRTPVDCAEPGPGEVFESALEMHRAGDEMVLADGKVRALRMLTKADDVGFGLSDVHINAGAEETIWYKNHWQANHILSGRGNVTDLASGQTWALEPSMAYNVGPKDRHLVRAQTDMHVLSVFSPALLGDELHDETGSFAPSGPVPAGPPGY